MYHITKKGDETVVEEGKRTLPKWADMSLVMLKIGLFTFGGGWSIVAQMQKEFVEKRGWLGEEELLDIVAIGRSFPGIMVVNTAVMLGYRIGGVGLPLRLWDGLSRFCGNGGGDHLLHRRPG